jgi:hypothetical protein
MTNFNGQRNLDIRKVFWSKIDKRSNNECWPYIHKLCSDGYGRFSIGHKLVFAHRYSYEIFLGCSIPEGKLVLHKCDNPRCCNPAHLYLGDYIDNSRDAWKRGLCNRSSVSHPKLYSGEIWLIKKLKVQIPSGKKRCWKFPARLVAKMFEVSEATIRRIWDSDKYICKEGYYA